MTGTNGTYIGWIDIEYCIIVRLAVQGKHLLQLGIHWIAIGLQRIDHHTPATERHNRPFQGRIRLQADDYFMFLVDIAGWV